MKYLHIRNLDKYHPKYKDRDLKWAKIYFQMVQGDPDCDLITNEIDWARLVKFILLELQAKQPIPLDDEYLRRKGFNLKKRSISLTLNVLRPFISIGEIRTLEEEKEEDKDKEKEKEEEGDRTVVTSSDSLDCSVPIRVNDVKIQWNIFADKNNLSKILTLTDSRKRKIRTRLLEPEFEFDKILLAIKQSKFLLGENEIGWKVNLDFIIKNETKYLEILEGRYNTNEKKTASTIEHLAKLSTRREIKSRSE